jgi:hypothetical protein
MSYDHWKTTEPDEPEEWAACDNCGVHKPLRQMRTIFTPGCETWACDECCGGEPEDDDGPELTPEECAERTREMLAPCTDLARRQGCTCGMDPYAYEEVMISRDCPLHGSPIDPDDAYHARTEAANEHYQNYR